ncbi:homocysteine S-methyltransferase family protein [SCandidatus Aminicenantes bacterium Aminicenantia_JdfR_composite]|nr:homocysteine S-methyltransferase family protein [SCandidatus Aminicenantes bacterium Aminicenantia_JdfR_composite]
MNYKKSILDIANERIVLFDGANGSQLIKLGLPKGTCPESWNIERPEIVKEVHRKYFLAGSDAVLTNTFGGNRIKLSQFGLGDRAFEINFKGAQLACEVKPEEKFVGGDIGPTGKFLRPYGTYTPEEFEEVFYEQADALVKGGVDFLIIETMYDLKEALCALKAAKRAGSMPVLVSLTFNKTKKGFFTLMGNSVEEVISELEKEGVDGIGANCTLNSEDMVPLVEEIRRYTDLPLIIQANAGQPIIDMDGNINYEQSVDDYVKYIPEIIKRGANIIGGCCGTDPHYIEKISQIIKQ